MNVNECAVIVSAELGISVDDARVRRYADLVGIERDELNYRDITDEHKETIKLIVVLFEFNISQETIVEFLGHSITAKGFKGMIDRIHSFKSHLVPLAEEMLSKYSFDKL